MKLENIPYFVKFIFHLAEDKCMSTTDSKMLEYVIDEKTGQKIDTLYIGQKLQFEPIDENPKIYEVTDIKIKQIFADTDLQNLSKFEILTSFFTHKP